MTDTIETRVARGVALLDEKLPGWDRRIDISELALSNCYRCVLGQLYGNRDIDEEETTPFHVGADELFGRDVFMEVADYGITTSGGFAEFAPLTAEWKRVILARRGGAR